MGGHLGDDGQRFSKNSGFTLDASAGEFLKTWAHLLAETPEVPRAILEWWLSDRLNASLTHLPLHAPVSDDDLTAFEAAVARLKEGEPVQYVCGRAPFRDLELKVDNRALIPRPETEQLVQIALDRFIKSGDRVLDIGTGSGCIALSIKQERPDCQVEGRDLSEEALILARENAQALGLDVRFQQADLLSAETFRSAEVILSNLPYIGEKEKADLPAGVRDFEPSMALFAGHDGTDLILQLLAQAREVLVPGGVLLLETGETQGEVWKRAADLLGWDLEGIQDLAGRERFWVFTQAL